LLARKSLENIVNGAIASAGNDGVELLADRHADLRGSIGSGPSGGDIHFDTRSAQHRASSFDILEPVFPPPARERIIKNGGSMHWE
jgi:hypothetical protein